MEQDIRWKQRHDNYHSIIKQLSTFLDTPTEPSLGDKLAAIKLFELGFELMWKLLKEYLQAKGVDFPYISPKLVLQTAGTTTFVEQTLVNGDILLKAHKTRNELVHAYDEEHFQQAYLLIKNSYFQEMLKLDNYFCTTDL